jgi:hypothetical protein
MQWCGSALVLMRIRIQLFASLKVRILAANPMRTHTDPDPGQAYPS